MRHGGRSIDSPGSCRRYSQTLRCIAIGFGLAAVIPISGACQEGKGGSSSEPQDFLSSAVQAVRTKAELAVVDTLDDPAGAPANPGNLVKDIARNTAQSQLRTSISYANAHEGITLRVDPTFELARTNYGADDAPYHGGTSTDPFVNGYLVRLQGAIPHVTLAASRQTLDWAPGYLYSPSDPFAARISIENPITEDRGSDFVWASYSPSWFTTISYYYNYARGEVRPPSYDPFRKTHALVTSYFSDEYSASLVLGEQRGRGDFIGSYGQWTAGEATLVYFDMAVRHGSSGLYPVSDPNFPAGGFYDETKHNKPLMPEVLVGASYTTQSDYTIYAEYLYYGLGYSNDELALSRRLNAQGAALFQTSQTLGLSTLGGAASNPLQFLGRHFANLQVVHKLGDVEVVVQNALSLQDFTGRLFSSISYAFGGHEIALTGLAFYGQPGGVFRQSLDYRMTVGYAYHF
jgi:hypothetical protein